MVITSADAYAYAWDIIYALDKYMLPDRSFAYLTCASALLAIYCLTYEKAPWQLLGGEI